MRTIIENSDITLAKKSGKRSECTAKATVKQHCIFAAEELGDAALKLAVQIRHSGKQRRTTSAESIFGQCFPGSRDHFRAIGQAKIIIGTKIYYRSRPAFVIDRGPCIRGREQLRLIKRSFPTARFLPLSESEWRN